jgi:phthalate 3,4-dioxygenase subunit beta
VTTHIPIRSSDSPLGQQATVTRAVGQTLPFMDERHAIAHQWVVDEAYILDRHDYAAWLDLLTEDIHYYMPVRVTTALGAGFDTAPEMAHFDEDKYSLARRVARFQTEHAWTEDPPSRVRRHVTNVRTFETDNDRELVVESAVLLYRSRGDVREAAVVSAGRQDVLRPTDRGWQLARRHIAVDDSVIRMQNLAMFL